MITATVIGILLISLGFGGNAARADNGCCGCKCGSSSLFTCTPYVPNVTYYAPYPVWFPQYFGPPYSDYQVVQYVTPPAESAAIVKARIIAINAGNPALLPPPPGEPLPPPKQTTLPPAK
jgi:hypothetical protein